jgi:hypothetical protein
MRNTGAIAARQTGCFGDANSPVLGIFDLATAAALHVVARLAPGHLIAGRRFTLTLPAAARQHAEVVARRRSSWCAADMLHHPINHAGSEDRRNGLEIKSSLWSHPKQEDAFAHCVE